MFLTQFGAQVRSWMRAVVRRGRLEEGMEAELADHLERLTEDLVRSGFEPAEAARRARIALGPALMHKEGMRASLGLKWWDELSGDLRYAVRLLRKSPGFTGIAAVSLALAIGANTAIFSVAKSLIYDRLHVDHVDELRLLGWTGDEHSAIHSMWGEFDPGPDGKMHATIFSYPVFLQLRAHNHALADLFGFKEDSMNATIRGNARRLNVAMVSGNFYAGMGTRPQLGRAIDAADDVPGAGAVAVISEGVWERDFGRSPAVLGQTITVNQTVLTVVGVNPRGFTGAKNVQASPEVFVPLSMQPKVDPKGRKGSLLDDPEFWWVNVMGRVKPGIPNAEARAALEVELAAAVRATMPVAAGDTTPHLDLTGGERGLNFAGQTFGKPMRVLMAFTGFVLLLACANIANLLLARGAQRQREMSVRLALGAGRARILRQMLTESLLLAFMGGAGGVLVGYLSRNAIPALMSNAWEANDLNARMDWGVFAFAAGVTLVTGLLFGLIPAWLAARSEAGGSLKENSRATTRRRGGLSGKAIVAFQIALSTMLVVGAGLFLRTLLRLNAVDVGFKTDQIILFEVSPPVQRYGPGKDVQLHQQLEQAIGVLPGVASVAPSSLAYIANNMTNQDFQPEEEPQAKNHGNAEYVNMVGNDFFHTMGIPILSGRGFGPGDTASSQKVAIINKQLALKRFPHASPVGKRFRTDGQSGWVQIVGVCADTRYANLRDDAPPQFFMPYVQQSEVGGMTYAVRSALSPSELVPALRRVVQRSDRDLPVVDPRTQRQQIDATMRMERLFASLTASFGVLALALACVGVYGVMAYAVSQRTNEIGIRLALGALPRQVQSMILRESTWLALVGIVSGVAGALALTRIVKSMLYGIKANDPLTFVFGVLILIAVALAAAWIPARRAAGVQPMEALRHE